MLCPRSLFLSQESLLCQKYGQYCINQTRALLIIDHHIQYLNWYQVTKGTRLRVDAMLIKPTQRITRYHMFLSSLALTCGELGDPAADYCSALSSILSCTHHINTMMWIGAMKDCPLDLAAQGQLLKQGTVRDRRDKKDKDKLSSCHLFLFKQCLVMCKARANKVEPASPHLTYTAHIRLVRTSLSQSYKIFFVKV